MDDFLSNETELLKLRVDIASLAVAIIWLTKDVNKQTAISQETMEAVEVVHKRIMDYEGAFTDGN